MRLWQVSPQNSDPMSPTLPQDIISDITGGVSFGPINLLDEPVNQQTIVDIQVPRMTPATPTVFADPTAWLQVDTEASFDGGATWVYAGGFGCWGGTHTLISGAIASFSGISLPYPAGQNRLLRGTLTISTTQRCGITIKTRSQVIP